MNLWIEIDSDTPFETGDVITHENEIVSSHDGDRGVFNKYHKIIFRPIKNDVLKVERKIIADKLIKFAEKILHN